MRQLALSADTQHLIGWLYRPIISEILWMSSWSCSQALRFRVKSRIPRQTSQVTGSADSITSTTPLPPPLRTGSTPALVALLALWIDTVFAVCIRALHESGRNIASLQETVDIRLGQVTAGAP